MIKKVTRIITDALITILLIGGIAFIASFFMGIEPFVVETGSMKPTIDPGSICFINKNVKYEDIRENDIIAFSIKTGKKVTHRAINITDQGIETKGDANDASDGVSTTKSNYIGKNIFSIPKLGFIIKFLQTIYGKVVLIGLIIVILVFGFLQGNKKEKVNEKVSKKDYTVKEEKDFGKRFSFYKNNQESGIEKSKSYVKESNNKKGKRFKD